MYICLLVIQCIGILLLALELLYVLTGKNSKLQVTLLMVLAATLVNCLGYLGEMLAGTQEVALQAVKFIYVGKPFVIFGILCFFLQYFNIKLHRFLYYILGILHVAVSILVFTCEHHDLYYRNIGYTDEGIFPHLICNHGFLYFLYHGVVIVYFASMLVLCAKNQKKAETSFERKQIVYLSLIAVLSVSALLIYFSGITGGYDVTNLAYIVSTVLLLILMTKYNLLDTMSLAKDRIVDELSEGVLVFDHKGGLIFANIKAQRIYPDIFGSESGQITSKLRQYSKLGEKLFLDENVYEIYEKEIVDHGVIHGSLLMLLDVTENYQYMIELEQQTEAAAKANRAKSEFLAMVSHEIRTPINAVLGMNEMILRESSEGHIRSYAADAKNAANALLGIINDILDSSKIESGKMDIILEEYELDSMLNDVANMVSLKAKEKNIQFEMLVEETLPNGLIGDDVRIRQVLTNLLNNSVKYTEKGSVSLHVTGRRLEEKLIMHFEIRDTGVGIKQEDMPRLFAVFERIEENKNHSIEGTGLGMHIVAELLALMGTKLEVESEYGKGSVFSFDLEQEVYWTEKIGNLASRSRDDYVSCAYQPMFQAPQAKILLVDDNDTNQKVFCGLLKGTKIVIEEADSGFACLKRVQESHYDLIFMDAMMPGMDGEETLRQMQIMEGNLCAGTPVVILTANAVSGARERYMRAGFHDYLSKPIKPEKLEYMCCSYLPQEMVTALRTDNEAAHPAGLSSSDEGKPEANETDFSVEEEDISLPDLEEFEWEYAKQYFFDTESLLATIWDIMNNVDEDIRVLDEWFALFSKYDAADGMDEDAVDALEQYRIRVHAIKSNMAAVGALLVSKLARLLEIFALEGEINKIQRLHSIFIEELIKHKNRMESLNLSLNC